MPEVVSRVVLAGQPVTSCYSDEQAFAVSGGMSQAARKGHSQLG